MIPIHKPYMPPNIMNELSQILYSGQLSYNMYGKKFEKSLTDFLGCENLLVVSSYNIAMLVLLSTLGLEPDDEIIASPMTCLASSQPFVTKRLKVIWADINPNTGTLCPISVKKKITKNTKAIFHNHFCGYVGEIDIINNIGSEYNIPVVDDCIEAFGSMYQDKYLGNLGSDASVFSFQTVRLPNTIDGGAIVFKDKRLFQKALSIRDYGIDRNSFRTLDGEINSNYDIKLEGYGGLMSEVNSYIGLIQMNHIKRLLQLQRDNASKWNNMLIDKSDLIPIKGVCNSMPNYWVYGLLSKNKSKSIKDFRDKGYFSSGVHVNNNIYSIFNNKERLKGVNDFMNKFIAIPSGWWL